MTINTYEIHNSYLQEAPDNTGITRMVSEADYISQLQQTDALQTSLNNIINAFGIKGEGAHSKLVIEYVHGLVAENGALQAANTHAALCINAAMVEGLLEALAESSDDRLVDLVNRRLLHAYQEVDSPLTEEQLWQMGDAILLEQLNDGTNFITRQSEIIANQNQRIAELESKNTDAFTAELRAQGLDAFAESVAEMHSKTETGSRLEVQLAFTGDAAVSFAANLRAGRKG